MELGAFGDWLAGFIDGEGCFQIVPVSGSRNYACQFALKLRADDLDVLQEIHQRLGVGQISSPRLDFGTADLRGSPSVRWTLRSKRDCLKLVEVLDRHPLRAKKAQDYAIWREAVMAWDEVRRASSDPIKLTANGLRWEEMAQLRERLIAGRIYAAATT